jgi:uncharacterized membrane protein YgdD (TMEM256/DUF423 family)
MSNRKLIGIVLWIFANYLAVFFIAFVDNLIVRTIGWLWISGAISFAGVMMLLFLMHDDNDQSGGLSLDP